MAGTNVAVTEEAVRTFQNMATQLLELGEALHTEVLRLKEVYDETKDGLGAHSASIEALLEDVGGAESDAGEQVKKLVLKLTRAALIRQSHIERERYSSLGRSR